MTNSSTWPGLGLPVASTVQVLPGPSPSQSSWYAAGLGVGGR
ncbi:hypothetical protein OIE67_14685 [Nonomuraea fuscirosea]|nr:hypothetical protein [Nonomuraea fuscirosea]WSA55799.1 hypothetical protein OIE67_14685 [Nonomuraea fuscirosea]